MSDAIAFDRQLTELAFRLTGNDRFTVLQAASKLRAVEEWKAKLRTLAR